MKLSQVTKDFATRKTKLNGGQRSPASIVSYTKRHARIDSMIQAIGDLDLDKEPIEDYAEKAINWFADQSSASGRTYMSDIRGAIKAYNPSINAKAFTCPEVEKEIEIIPENVFKDLFMDCIQEDTELHRAIVLMCITGARVSDVLSFSPDNFLIEDEQVIISYKQSKKKTAKPITIPYTDPEIVYYLKSIDKTFRKDRNSLHQDLLIWLKKMPYMGDDWISHNTKVDGRTEIQVKSVSELIRFHNIRKTFISTMFSLGINENVIKYFSGHSSGRDVFSKNYLSISYSRKDSAMRKYISQLWQG